MVQDGRVFEIARNTISNISLVGELSLLRDGERQSPERNARLSKL